MMDNHENVPVNTEPAAPPAPPPAADWQPVSPLRPDGVKRKRPEDSMREIIFGIVLALIFLILFYLLYQGFRGSDGLASAGETQKTLYAGGFAFLISGIAVAFLTMMTSKAKAKERPVWFFPVMAGFLAFIGLGLAYFFLGIWPVGAKTGMIVDMHHQYAPLLSKLRDMILHGSNPLYSFEIGMGASFIPAFGYYLASPLNILLVLFPERLLAEGIFVITIVKNILCAVTFAVMLQYVYKKRSPAVAIAAMMYAMSMYVLAYSWCIMWLDGLMVLPLVIMGLERLMRTGKYPLYVLSLAYALYANYYIGFMICIFTVLYYIAFVIRKRRSGIQAAGSFLRFVIGSVLGGGIAAFMVIPIYLALGSTSAAGGSLPDLAANINVFQLFGRQLYEITPTIRSQVGGVTTLPNIYCGLLTFFLVPVFAMCKSIPARRRIAYLGMVGVIAMSFVLNQWNLIWHGLHAPNDLPYRFSFVYTFLLVLIAYEVMTHLDKISVKSLAASLLGISFYLVIEEQFGNQIYSFKTLYYSFAFIVVYFIITALIARKTLALRVGYCLLLLVVSIEMVSNASVTLKALDSKEYYTAHDNYVDNAANVAARAAIDKAKQLGDAESNGAFYRMETMPRLFIMNTAMYNYRGISSFASSNSYATTRFMGAMGYAVNGVNSYLYNGFMAPTDSLLGIKYLVLDQDLPDHPQLQKIDTVTTPTKDGLKTDYIYRNKDALPVAFVANKAVESYESSYYNPITSLNTLYADMTGIQDPIYFTMQPQLPDGSTQDITISGATGFSFNPSGGSETGNIEVPITEDGTYYVYVDCRAAKSISVQYGSNTGGISPNEPYFIEAAGMKAGDVITVGINADSSASGNIYVAELNQPAFDKSIAQLKAEGLNVTKFTESSITGTVHTLAGGTMFTSIPYDAGWSVTVDGKKVDTFGIDTSERGRGLDTPEAKAGSVDGALLGFDIPAGNHTVKMTFMPKGLAPGLLISIVALVILVFAVLFLRKKTALHTLLLDVSLLSIPAVIAYMILLFIIGFFVFLILTATGWAGDGLLGYIGTLIVNKYLLLILLPVLYIALILLRIRFPKLSFAPILFTHENLDEDPIADPPPAVDPPPILYYVEPGPSGVFPGEGKNPEPIPESPQAEAPPEPTVNSESPGSVLPTGPDIPPEPPIPPETPEEPPKG